MMSSFKKRGKFLLAATPTPFYGEIKIPGFLQRLIPANFQNVPGAGLIIFANMLLRVFFIVAGLYAVWNFIQAGWIFMSSGGDVKQVGMARDKILFSILGLLVMASSLVLAAIIGVIIFDDPTALIQPKLLVAPTPIPTP